MLITLLAFPLNFLITSMHKPSLSPYNAIVNRDIAAPTASSHERLVLATTAVKRVRRSWSIWPRSIQSNNTIVQDTCLVTALLADPEVATPVVEVEVTVLATLAVKPGKRISFNVRLSFAKPVCSHMSRDCPTKSGGGGYSSFGGGQDRSCYNCGQPG